MNVFSIKDLEALSGIKAHTIRIWEQRYSLLRPNRTDTNIRTYNNEELRNLLNIALLNKHGYKISSITRMTEAEINEKILTLTQEPAQTEWLINQLIIHMSELDVDTFEALVDKQIRQNGLKKTVMTLIFPFLSRIGMLWQTHHINPAQEHLVSQLIRQKVIAATDRLRVPVSGKPVALFLPPGEYHELSLLFVQFLMKSEGIPVLYLGADVPLADIRELLKLKELSCLYTHITSLPQKTGFEKLINNISLVAGKTPVYISGRHAQLYNGKLPTGIMLKKTFEEIQHFIMNEI